MAAARRLRHRRDCESCWTRFGRQVRVGGRVRRGTGSWRRSGQAFAGERIADDPVIEQQDGGPAVMDRIDTAEYARKPSGLPRSVEGFDARWFSAQESVRPVEGRVAGLSWFGITSTIASMSSRLSTWTSRHSGTHRLETAAIRAARPDSEWSGGASLAGSKPVRTNGDRIPAVVDLDGVDRRPIVWHEELEPSLRIREWHQTVCIRRRLRRRCRRWACARQARRGTGSSRRSGRGPTAAGCP